MTNYRRFVLEIVIENAAFTPDQSSEVVRILHNLADGLERDAPRFPVDVLDCNGNWCGRARLDTRRIVR